MITKQQKRHIENQKYMAHKKAIGWRIATFVVPDEIIPEIKSFIAARKKAFEK